MIQAYISLHPSNKRLILVLDNIDRIPSDLQPRFLAACQDIQLSCGSVCSTAITVRTENARAISIAPGDERFADVFLLDNEKYSALLLPSLESTQAQKVLEAREAFAREILLEYDQSNKTSWQILEERHLQPYHSSVVSEFIDDKVHALANDSYRTLLNLYVEFMRYIWTTTHYKDSSGRVLTNIVWLRDERYEKHLQTLFYLWLNQRGNDVGIPIQDIVEHDFDPKALTFAQAASPRHLLLSCIHSYSGELRANGFDSHWPMWSDVAIRMEELGFDYGTIRNALCSFLTPIGEPAGFLRLEHREINSTEIQKSSNDRIIITKLGREIVENVINKVGYVWGLARMQVETADSSKNYYSFDAFERAQHIYEYAKQLCVDHLRILGLLGLEWRGRYHEGWTQIYRSRFGVNKRLQSEAILDSAASFYGHLFKNAKRDNPFVSMRQIFSRLFADLSYGELVDSDIKKLDVGDNIVYDLKSGKR